MLDDVQRAAIERAIETLNQKPDYSHSAVLINRIAGKAASKQIAELRDEYRSANEAAQLHGGAMLSADAADYWQEAQGVLRYARIALAGNDRERRREKALSRKCERLLESFDRRVPDADKGKFVHYDPQSLGAQDSRWDWTVDGPFPLLSPAFQESLPVRNPLGEAQRAVLGSLLDRTEVEEHDCRVGNTARLTTMLRAMLEDRSAAEQKAAAAAYRKLKAAGKTADASKRKAERDALIAAGDQKATKARRGKKLTLVTDLFEKADRPKVDRKPKPSDAP